MQQQINRRPKKLKYQKRCAIQVVRMFAMPALISICSIYSICIEEGHPYNFGLIPVIAASESGQFASHKSAWIGVGFDLNVTLTSPGATRDASNNSNKNSLVNAKPFLPPIQSQTKFQPPPPGPPSDDDFSHDLSSSSPSPIFSSFSTDRHFDNGGSDAKWPSPPSWTTSVHSSNWESWQQFSPQPPPPNINNNNNYDSTSSMPSGNWDGWQQFSPQTPPPNNNNNDGFTSSISSGNWGGWQKFSPQPPPPNINNNYDSTSSMPSSNWGGWQQFSPQPPSSNINNNDGFTQFTTTQQQRHRAYKQRYGSMLPGMFGNTGGGLGRSGGDDWWGDNANDYPLVSPKQNKLRQ